MYHLDDGVAVERFAEPSLRAFVESVLRALGASGEEARINADGVITASLWWHPGQGQGLEKLFRYARRMRNGGIRPNAAMSWAREGPATALLDAGKGLGYVAARRAMDRAIEIAKQSGIAMVAVRHSNHFGIAGYHAKRAADAGLIGIAMTNAGAEMAPWGATRPILGTNPWGIAVPRGGHHPIILDMALTQSGKGMMRWLDRAGLPMPDTWALTADGARTTDPGAAMDGPLLPIGDYKGYGLSLITDALTGVLTGSLFGAQVFQDDENYDVAHTMIAIRIEAFIARRRFDERLEALIADVLTAPPIDPDGPVQLPGQAEQERARWRLEHGIPVDGTTVAGLRDLARELGVPFALEPVA
ncbi:MAG: Ldh family oxidoreductase [Gemmatimonadota bacterium]|nr:Ldh family oxidoreductase [Gemmatimonadota bacterium]